MPDRAARRAWLRWVGTVGVAGVLPALPAAAAAPFLPALPPQWSSGLPPLRLVGNGRLTWMGVHVYDARLWLPGPSALGDAIQPRPPMALELQYARALRGQRIAERSLEEMRRQGPLTSDVAHAWLARMRALFPDVVAGDRLCGVQRSDGATLFLHNDSLLGDVAEPAFGARFFGIWLSAHTSQPGLRRQLLGLPG